jgi:chaperonin GroES
MKIRPLDDRIVVRRLNADSKSKGGIIIPDNAQEKRMEGEVLKVGPGRWAEDGKHRIEPRVKVSDRIVFERYAGQDITRRTADWKGGEYLIIREYDVLGVIEESDEEVRT